MLTVPQKYISIIDNKMNVFVHNLLGEFYMLSQKGDLLVAYSFILVAALSLKHFALKATEYVQQAEASGVTGTARQQRASANELVGLCVYMCTYTSLLGKNPGYLLGGAPQLLSKSKAVTKSQKEDMLVKLETLPLYQYSSGRQHTVVILLFVGCPWPYIKCWPVLPPCLIRVTRE